MTPADEVSWPDDAVEVGRIVDAWGIKGGFKVQPFSADPQALFSSRRWFLRPAELAAAPAAAPAPQRKPAAPRGLPVVAAAPLPSLLKITSAKEHGDVVVATAQEVADRTAAERLKGARVFVSRQSFPSADTDEFYWVDLIGLQVFNRDGALLGTVTDLLETGAHCVLRVRRPDAAPNASPDEAERLIPFVNAFVDEVDLPGKRLTVDWGLDY